MFHIELNEIISDLNIHPRVSLFFSFIFLTAGYTDDAPLHQLVLYCGACGLLYEFFNNEKFDKNTLSNIIEATGIYTLACILHETAIGHSNVSPNTTP